MWVLKGLKIMSISGNEYVITYLRKFLNVVVVSIVVVAMNNKLISIMFQI